MPARIIPARAGFTTRESTPRWKSRDHPRSRGVYTLAHLSSSVMSGSSPLARGLPQEVSRRAGGAGIIPARAGFTSLPNRDPRSLADHPRSRGVYQALNAADATLKGSSPLARGLRMLARPRMVTAWIIPARAGFTLPQIDMLVAHRDHPRSRGVYRRVEFLGGDLAGSSPLARGLPLRLHGVVQRLRIIPARAGFTVPGEP